jgi:hypothetical protein
MIKFFRKIRQQLIAEKRISQYLLYALGEIVLVVAGILIALAINNGNEQRLTRNKEQVYLKGLQEEFKVSQYKLKNLIALNQQNAEGARTLLRFMSDSTTLTDEAAFSKLIYSTLAYDIAFNPNNSLLNEMINSGSLRDLSNPELRRRLTNWIATLEDVARQEQDQEEERTRILNTFLSDRYSIRTVLEQSGLAANELGLAPSSQAPSNLPLLQSRSFENHLLLFLLACAGTTDTHYLPLMEELEGILELIDREIEN